MLSVSLLLLENNVVAINLYKKLGFKTVGTLPENLKRNDKQIEIFLMSLSNNEWKKIKPNLIPKKSYI